MARPRKGLRSRARGDAQLDYLPYEQHEQLCRWLLTSGLSLTDIEAKVRKQFGFRISHSAISQFNKVHVLPHLQDIRARAVSVAAGYVETAAMAPGHFSAAAMDAMEARAMRAVFDPSISPKDLKIFLELVCRWHDLRLRGEQVKIQLRRLKLLERKQKKLEAVFDVESKLSSDEVAQRCRVIFKQNGEIEPQSERPEEKLLPSITP